MDDEPRFGDYLKTLIKVAGMTQNEFYSQWGIKKPYFYDIVSSKINPPPPYLQYKAVEILKMSEKEREKFFDLAAKERDETPADILKILKESPSIKNYIRHELKQALYEKTRRIQK